MISLILIDRKYAEEFSKICGYHLLVGAVSKLSQVRKIIFDATTRNSQETAEATDDFSRYTTVGQSEVPQMDIPEGSGREKVVVVVMEAKVTFVFKQTSSEIWL